MLLNPNKDSGGYADKPEYLQEPKDRVSFFGKAKQSPNDLPNPLHGWGV
jgi:hypothetical protein